MSYFKNKSRQLRRVVFWFDFAVPTATQRGCTGLYQACQLEENTLAEHMGGKKPVHSPVRPVF